MPPRHTDEYGETEYGELPVVADNTVLQHIFRIDNAAPYYDRFDDERRRAAMVDVRLSTPPGIPLTRQIRGPLSYRPMSMAVSCSGCGREDRDRQQPRQWITPPTPIA